MNLRKKFRKILIPQIQHLTNDSWEDITCLASGSGYPILLQSRYAKGSLFVLTVPDIFGEIYKLPPEVLNRIRNVLSQAIRVRIEGPAQVSLYLYDNNTFKVQSFLHENVNIKVVTDKQTAILNNIMTSEEIISKIVQDGPVWGRERGDVMEFDVSIKPHSFLVFQYK